MRSARVDPRMQTPARRMNGKGDVAAEAGFGLNIPAGGAERFAMSDGVANAMCEMSSRSARRTQTLFVETPASVVAVPRASR